MGRLKPRCMLSCACKLGAADPVEQTDDAMDDAMLAIVMARP